MSKRDTTNGETGVDERVVEAVAPEPTETSTEGGAAEERQRVYAARWGRGRIGGTGTVLLLGQRAIAGETIIAELGTDPLLSGTSQ